MVICIVEPLASANYLANRLKEEGFSTVLLQIKNSLEQGDVEKYVAELSGTVNQELWDNVITFDCQNNTMESLVLQLQSLNVDYIYYGCEYIVNFTDRLNAIYNPLRGNSPQNSSNRYNKFMMQQALASHGMLIPRQDIISSRMSKAELEAITTKVKFPSIIKPQNSYGSIGVAKINNLDELEKRLLAEREESQFVIQEFIVGDEYIVDSFSLNGSHYFCQLGKYKKEIVNGDVLYCYMIIVNDDELCKLITDYMVQTLDAVELKNGFAHTELFVTKDRQVYLVEVNPRVSGLSGMFNMMVKECYGCDQIDLIKNALTENKPAIKLIEQSKYGMIALVYNFDCERVYNGLHLDLITSLPSYFMHMERQKIGATLRVGGNLMDVVVCVTLISESLEQLYIDYAKIEEYEKSGDIFKQAQNKK